MQGINDLSIADRYAAVADNFSRLVRGVQDWDAPTPVAEWRACDVVGHLVSWVPGMVGGGSGLDLPEGDASPADPAAAWEALDTRLRAILADADAARTIHSNPHTGSAPVDRVIDQYVTSDLVFHAWDLARASGQDPQLDQDFIAGAFEGMQGMSEVIRGSGQFGEQRPVPEDATTEERFFAFIGRDPRWTP